MDRHEQRKGKSAFVDFPLNHNKIIITSGSQDLSIPVPE